jgi:transcriptional regulator with XRE-family HTH domain
MSIGSIIRNLRKEKGLSQEEFAKLLFVSQDTVSLWELDKSLPDIETLIKISKLFNVTIEYIVSA